MISMHTVGAIRSNDISNITKNGIGNMTKRVLAVYKNRRHPT